ncbi:MAG: ATP-dependent DNA helicase [bacterium]|nr:ATP-dependent DNA helicase [bacterium]
MNLDRVTEAKQQNESGDARSPSFPEQRVAPTGWADAIADTDGPQLVVAGPGAGKTEFLVRRIASLTDRHRVPGSAILALTFSRRAAAGLNTRIRAATRDPLGGVGASTFHSFAQRILEMHAAEAIGWTGLPSILTGPEQVDLVSQLLTTEEPVNWPSPFRNLLSTRTLADEVTDFILRARERMMDAAELERRCAERDDWRALPGFVARYDQALEQSDRIDYGTLVNRAIEVLADPWVQESVLGQYSYVLVDEYQDTTPAQATLLAAVSGPRGNITVAADPYQSIYGFRGASLSNVAGFFDRFPGADAAPGRKWVLGTSFRVPREILRAAERLTVGVDLPGAAGPVEPASHPGRVELRVFDQESEESEWIAAEAARLNLEQEIPFSRMAVLVRTKRRLLTELSRALDRRSIPHDRPDARLVDHPAARMIFDVARSAASPDRRAATPFMRSLLLGPLYNLGVGGLRRMERHLWSGEEGWPEVIRLRLEGGEPLASLLDDPSWIDSTAIDGFWKVWTGLPQFRPLVADPGRAEFRAAWTSLAQALVRAAERNPATTLLDYVRLVESDDFEASPLLSYKDPAEDRMVLTTLHQVKGLEFDVVFVADAVEGVLPDLRRTESLLRTEQLDPAASGALRGSRRRLREETRLVYTAITRARNRVVMTATSAGPDEEHRRPSRFLEVVAGDELDIACTYPRIRLPITMREAESWLRTILVDPAQPDHRRLGAARILGAGNHDGLRPPLSYAAVRRAGADAGILAPGRRLSPSDAGGYDACPRRFALERVLRVSNPANRYLAFGNLIHSVLEVVENRAASEARRATFEEARACLEDLLPEYDLGSGSILKAWQRRAILLLTRLYAGWPRRDTETVLVEHVVEAELGGVRWRGRIDRVVRERDGTISVVDYKTGKTPLLVREVSRSLQLGFYFLAACSDPGVGRHGLVRSAEFWYPLAATPKRRVMSFDPAHLEEVRSRLGEIAGLVLGEDWTPTPGKACRGCTVKAACPAWPEGQEAYHR